MPEGFKITRGSGFQLTFANGMTVSVQFGGGTYSSNRGAPYGEPTADANTAETAIWNKNGDWIKRLATDGDTVQGWQSPDDVAATITWAASLPEDFAWPVVADPEED